MVCKGHEANYYQITLQTQRVGAKMVKSITSSAKSKTSIDRVAEIMLPMLVVDW